MKIYNVLYKDRHSDTTATPFTDLNKAIEYARGEAHENSEKYPKDYKEEDIEGWLFYVEYSCEGDCLWITEHEITNPCNSGDKEG